MTRAMLCAAQKGTSEKVKAAPPRGELRQVPWCGDDTEKAWGCCGCVTCFVHPPGFEQAKEPDEWRGDASRAEEKQLRVYFN